METVLLIGGTGFIGKNLSRAFVAQGFNVLVYSEYEESESSKDSYHEQISYFIGTLNELDKLETIFKNHSISQVIHLVSSLGPSSNQEAYLKEFDLVIIPTIRLIDFMNKYHVKKLMFFSSGGTIYGNYKENGHYCEKDELNPINYYGLSKLQLEEIIKFECLRQDIDYVFLRPSNPFGRYQNINGQQGLIPIVLGKVLRNEVIEVWGDGKTIRDYIPIEYLTQCVVELSKLSLKNEIINIGSGRGHSVNEILEIIKKVTNLDLNIDHKPSRSVDSKAVVLNVEKLKSLIEVEDFELETAIKAYYDKLKESLNA